MRIIATHDGGNANNPAVPDWWKEQKVVQIGDLLFLQDYDLHDGCRKRIMQIDSADQLPTWLDEDAMEDAVSVLNPTKSRTHEDNLHGRIYRAAERIRDADALRSELQRWAADSSFGKLLNSGVGIALDLVAHELQLARGGDPNTTT